MKNYILLFLIFCAGGLNAGNDDLSLNHSFGNIKFELFSVEEGLSSSVIYSFNQDNKGFLWIGTGEGLNRYDGYNFKTYKHIPFDTTSLSDNWILSIKPDSRDDLWIGTHNGGLNRLDKESGKFRSYKFELNNPNSIASDRVWNIEEDKPGYLWVSTSGGLCYFDIDANKFTRYVNDPANPNSIPGNSVNNVFRDSKGNSWVGIFGQGICRIDKSGENVKFVYPPFKQLETVLKSAMIKIISEDKFGNLWLGTYRNGLIRYNPQDDSAIQFLPDNTNKYSITQSSVFGILFDTDGNLWAGTHDEGICILPEKMLNIKDPKDARFYHLAHNSSDQGSLSNNSTIALFKDSNDIIWVGTDKGVNKYNSFRAKFVTISFKDLGIDRSSGSFVKSAFHDSEGTYWFGTYNDGLYRYNAKNNSVIRYVTMENNRDGLSNNTVWAILEEKPGEYWFGTSYGLNYYIEAENRFIHYYRGDNTTGLSHNNISALLNYDDKYLFVGTWGAGINILDKETGAIYKYANNYEENTSLSSNLIKSFYLDSDRNLWIATFGGGVNFVSSSDLKDMIPGALQFEHYRHDSENKNSLSSDNVTNFIEAGEGLIWCGTFGGGLNKIEISKNNAGSITSVKFNSYLEEDGLADNTIYNLLPDENNNIWMSTNKGISRFDVEKNTFFNYDKKDGLQDNEFDQGACKDDVGNLVFGGTAGINIFNPVHLVSAKKNAPMVVTSVRKFGPGMSNETELGTDREIIIDYTDYFFTIEFASLDFTRPEKNQYAYMLEGFDEDWILAGNKRSVRYTNLDGGNYKFLVRGTDSEGVWGEHAAEFSLMVTSPPWTRWWAFVVYILVFGLVVFGFIRFTGREHRREIKLRQRELEMERNVSRQLREEEKLKETLYKISEAVSESANIDDLFVKVHEIIRSLIHANNFYIALYNQATGTIEFPYYIDEKENLKATKIPPEKLENSLTEYLIRKGEPTLISDKDFNKLVRDGEVKLLGPSSYEWLGVPLKNSTGEIIGALVVQNYTSKPIYNMRDLEVLTFVSSQIGIAIERKQNEDVRNKYDFIVNTSRAFMTMIDRDFNYVAVNEAFCFRHKKTRNEIIGNHVSTVWGESVFKDTLKVHLDKAFAGETVSYQAWFDNTDGETGCFEVEYYPYRDESQAVTHVVVVTRDITELVKAEENVRKLMSAVEQAGDVVFMTTMEGDITFANPAFKKIYGYEIKDVIGENTRILRSGKTGADVYKNLWETILDGKTFRGEMINRTIMGEEIEIEITISPVFDQNTHIMGFISVQSDITTRKEAERKLVEAKELAEKSAQLKSDFLSQMSHEVRTPLNSIINMVELVEEELQGSVDDSTAENLEFLKLSARRILRTVHMILDMSEVQSGLMNVSKENFDVCELFESVITEYKPLVADKELEFNYKSYLKNCQLNSDKYWVEQIFHNLIDNAVKFTESGEITVELRRNGSGAVEFSVKDTGTGIAEDFLPNLYEPFSQEDQGYARRYEGTGIGLALVKRYCELLGASISVNSVKGEGSRFTVSLPA